MSDLISATAADFRSALEEFEAAWENPNHTRVTLPAVQVNSVLAEKYTTSSPIRLTRHMVWDMEQQKAWDPATFIPYVVSEGKSWGRHARLHNCHDDYCVAFACLARADNCANVFCFCSHA